MCKTQMESDEEFYSTKYNAIACIWKMAIINPNLLSSHFFEAIELSTKVCCLISQQYTHLSVILIRAIVFGKKV